MDLAHFDPVWCVKIIDDKRLAGQREIQINIIWAGERIDLHRNYTCAESQDDQNAWPELQKTFKGWTS